MDEWRIHSIDFWEQDAFLELDGNQIYFQFPSGVEPTLMHVLDFLRGEIVRKKGGNFYDAG